MDRIECTPIENYKSPTLLWLKTPFHSPNDNCQSLYPSASEESYSLAISIGISILVAVRIITGLRSYIDPEAISVSLNNFFLDAEMLFFAFAHIYALANIAFALTSVTSPHSCCAYSDTLGIQGPRTHLTRWTMMRTSRLHCMVKGCTITKASPSNDTYTRVPGAIGTSI